MITTSGVKKILPYVNKFTQSARARLWYPMFDFSFERKNIDN